MDEEAKDRKLSLQELMVSNLAMTEAAVMLLIAKGVFTEADFKENLSAERPNYWAVMKRMD